jgi:hypothetical protein
MTTPTVRPPRVKAGLKLSREHDRRITEYINTSVPEKHKVATERALRGQMGNALAVKQKCLQCSGYQVTEIGPCTVITCALWPVRPYQK